MDCDAEAVGRRLYITGHWQEGQRAEAARQMGVSAPVSVLIM